MSHVVVELGYSAGSNNSELLARCVTLANASLPFKVFFFLALGFTITVTAHMKLVWIISVCVLLMTKGNIACKPHICIYISTFFV